MSVYLDVVWALAEEFESIALTLKPKNGIQHAYAFVYLAATLEDDSPRRILVDNLKSPSISWVKRDLNTTIHSAQIFLLIAKLH